jgi:hypothetical protein
MGVPIPQNMDGHVLSSAISETLLTQLSISYSEAVDDTPSLSPEMNSEEERIIRERLEALGYVS